MKIDPNPILESRERQRERRRSFGIFFSVAFLVYVLINTYILIRLNQAIPDNCWLNGLFIPLFLFISLSFIVGQILERKSSSFLATALTWIGSFWLGAMTWFFPALLIIDLLMLADRFIGFLPQGLIQRTETIQWTVGIASFAILVSMFLGFLNARKIRVKPMAIKIDKPLEKPLRIAALSDMHMGSLVRKRMVRQMVQKINSIKPDIVLMVGDQIDGNPHPVMQLDLGAELAKIESKYGVFAITGNHEYIGNAETSCAYLEAHGVRMIRDEVLEVPCVPSVLLVGREDRASKQFANIERKSLSELVQGIDKSKPIILMDHTPFHLEEAENNGIDLQLSGHTHHGQLWPWNFITQRVYEVSWGYKRKGKTQYYVSCGAGTWGPPIRIGNSPEIMDITLSFGGG